MSIVSFYLYFIEGKERGKKLSRMNPKKWCHLLLETHSFIHSFLPLFKHVFKCLLSNPQLVFVPCDDAVFSLLFLFKMVTNMDFFKNWSIVVLQCCVSFYCTAK